MKMKHRPPTHPGEILLEEFMKPLNYKHKDLAPLLGISISQLMSITQGDERITSELAFRLAGLFRTTIGFWATLQMQYDRFYHNKEKQ